MIRCFDQYKYLGKNLLSICLMVSSSLILLQASTSCETEKPGDQPMFSRSKMLTLVNKARQSGQNCGNKWYPPVNKLAYSDELEEAAKAHSEDMYNNNFFSHKGSDGHFVGDRLYDQHYFWKACGENVAYGALYEDEVMNEWLKSAGHCVNMMNPSFTEIGVWLTGLYWTQVFAKPQ
ncbi:MAG: CAP domain-containing protein [Bacteroidales bacterium]|jgi:uncharacterized protein YkwD